MADDYSALDALPDAAPQASLPAQPQAVATAVSHDYSALDNLPEPTTQQAPPPTIRNPLAIEAETNMPELSRIPILNEPYISPYRDRGDDMYKNAVQDLVGFKQAGMAAASLPLLRAREISQGQPAFRSTDLPQLGDALKESAKYFVHEYMEAPAARPTGLGYLQYFAQHFQKAPIDTVVNLLPWEIAALKIAKGTAKAATPLAEALTKGAKAIAPGKLPPFAAPLSAAGKAMGLKAAHPVLADYAGRLKQFISEHVPNWQMQLEDSKYVSAFTQKFLQDKAHALIQMQSWIKAFDRDWWNPKVVPLHPYLLGALEQTDAQLQKMVKDNPAVERLNHTTKKKDAWMRKALGIDAKEAERATWGMSFLAKVKSRQIERIATYEHKVKLNPNNAALKARLEKWRNAPDLQFRDLDEPEVKAELDKFIADKKARGIVEPIHAAIGTAHMIRSLLSKIQQEGIGTVAREEMQAAIDEARTGRKLFQRPPEERPGWAKPRMESSAGVVHVDKRLVGNINQWFGRGPQQFMSVGRKTFHERNPRVLFEYDVARTIDYNRTKDLIKWALDQEPQDVPPHWKEVDLKPALHGILRHIARDEQHLEQLTNETLQGQKSTVKMPPQAASRMNRILGQPSRFFEGWGLDKPIPFLHQGRTFYTRWKFGRNPIFGAALHLQTLALQLWHIKSPKDALALAAGYMLANHPASTHVMPSVLTMSHGVHESVAMLKAGISWNKFWDNLAHHAIWRPHEATRRASAFSALLYENDKAPPKIQSIVKDMLNTTIAMERAAKMTYRTAELERMMHTIRPIVGDYSKLSYEEMTAMHDILPTFGWTRHLYNAVTDSIWSHPKKLAALASLKVVLEPMTNAKEGGLPLRTSGGEPELNPKGQPKFFHPNWDLLPLAGGAELVRTGLDMFRNAFPYGAPTERERVEIGSGLNPMLKVGVDQFQGFGAKKSRRSGKVYAEDLPSWTWDLARAELPNAIRPIDRQIARPGVPTRATQPGHPAPLKKAVYDPAEEHFNWLGLGGY